jgi:hypothetical protein
MSYEIKKTSDANERIFGNHAHIMNNIPWDKFEAGVHIAIPYSDLQKSFPDKKSAMNHIRTVAYGKGKAKGCKFGLRFDDDSQSLLLLCTVGKMAPEETLIEKSNRLIDEASVLYPCGPDGRLTPEIARLRTDYLDKGMGNPMRTYESPQDLGPRVAIGGGWDVPADSQQAKDFLASQSQDQTNSSPWLAIQNDFNKED